MSPDLHYKIMQMVNTMIVGMQPRERDKKNYKASDKTYD